MVRIAAKNIPICPLFFMHEQNAAHLGPMTDNYLILAS
jgi:hypothetical protein